MVDNAAPPIQLPAGLQQRQSWRPQGRRATSVASNIMARLEKMTVRTEHLSSWHDRMMQRLQPWSGWSPLSMDLQGKGVEVDSNSPRESAPHRPISDRGSTVEEKPATTVPSVTDSPSLPKTKGKRQIRGRDRTDGQRRVTRGNRVEHRGKLPKAVPLRLQGENTGKLPKVIPSKLQGNKSKYRAIDIVPKRTAIKLAVLGKTTATGDSTTSSPPGKFPLIQRQPATTSSSAAPETQPLQTRLTLTVSPTPRKEIPGGFPSPTSHAQRNATPTFSQPRSVNAASIPKTTEPDITERTLKASPVEPQNPSQSAPEAIETLINQTIVPEKLSGLQVRLASPKPQEIETSDREQPQDNSLPPPNPPTLSPPQVDINAIADKVEQTLMRRQQLERERKGLY